MEQAVNLFTKGLQMDTNPMLQGSDTLTDALNATIITMNGNEVVLQNDMGNRRVDNAYLPSGYEPVGIKEHGGIIYIASYNPITGKSLIGSFPSPERKLNNLDLGLPKEISLDLENRFFGEDNITSLDNINFLKSDSILIPITNDTSLHAGDKFVVYENNNNKDSELNSKDITNYDNINEDKIESPKNKLYTLSLGILNSLNVFNDITPSLQRWKRLGKEDKIISFEDDNSDLYKFNSGYFIPKSYNPPTPGTESDEELIKERLKCAANTYAYKLVGPMYLKAELNHVRTVNFNVGGVLNKTNGENNKKTYDASIWVEAVITYNCPDGGTGEPIGNDIYYDLEEYKVNNKFFDLYYKYNNKYYLVEEPTGSSDSSSVINNGNIYNKTTYDPITNLYTVKIVKKYEIKGFDKDFDYFIGVRAREKQVNGNYIYLQEQSYKGSLDLSLLGSGTIKLKEWRFLNNYNNQSTILTYAFDAYPKYGEEFVNLKFEFEEFIPTTFDGKNILEPVKGTPYPGDGEGIVKSDYTVTLPSLRREGYKFYGWGSKDVKSGDTDFDLREDQERTLGKGTKVTLYAHWKKDEDNSEDKFEAGKDAIKTSPLKTVYFDINTTTIIDIGNLYNGKQTKELNWNLSGLDPRKLYKVEFSYLIKENGTVGEEQSIKDDEDPTENAKRWFLTTELFNDCYHQASDDFKLDFGTIKNVPVKYKIIPKYEVQEFDPTVSIEGSLISNTNENPINISYNTTQKIKINDSSDISLNNLYPDYIKVNEDAKLNISVDESIDFDKETNIITIIRTDEINGSPAKDYTKIQNLFDTFGNTCKYFIPSNDKYCGITLDYRHHSGGSRNDWSVKGNCGLESTRRIIDKGACASYQTYIWGPQKNRSPYVNYYDLKSKINDYLNKTDGLFTWVKYSDTGYDYYPKNGLGRVWWKTNNGWAIFKKLIGSNGIDTLEDLIEDINMSNLVFAYKIETTFYAENLYHLDLDKKFTYSSLDENNVNVKWNYYITGGNPIDVPQDDFNLFVKENEQLNNPTEVYIVNMKPNDQFLNIVDSLITKTIEYKNIFKNGLNVDSDGDLLNSNAFYMYDVENNTLNKHSGPYELTLYKNNTMRGILYVTDETTTLGQLDYLVDNKETDERIYLTYNNVKYIKNVQL